MKSLFAVVLGILALLPFGACATAWDADLTSCDDLRRISVELEQVSKTFAKNAHRITEGDELDQLLGELIDALDDIADAEKDKTLDKALDALTDAYNKMDAERFGASLKRVISSFDKLYRRDC